MSVIYTYHTAIKSHERLKRACDWLRGNDADFAAMRGPHFKANHPTRLGPRDVYAVKLPGWTADAYFLCDNKGVCLADNESPYFDERQEDEQGNKIEGTGRVHRAVLEGHKRPGEDGTWGDIKFFERLKRVYAVMPHIETAEELGHTVSDFSWTDTNELDVEIETPELEVAT